MKVYRQLLESCADAAELFQPADTLFGDAAAAVGPAIEPYARVMSCRLIFLVRYHRRDLLLTEPIPQALHAVAL